MGKKLVIGANGQIGSDLVDVLITKHGRDNIIASDISEGNFNSEVIFEQIDVLDADALRVLVDKHNIKEIYLLAALLSATAEKKPLFGWSLNINGLLNVLELARNKVINKIFWPSSIAVFGPSSPSENTPQTCIMEPTTVYGISKLAGERWCAYYFNRYGVDVRSIRYPGLISYKTVPGGGTTDYAVDVYIKAVREGSYTCYLSKNTHLPMMYMTEAIRATIELMEADSNKLSVRSSYNISGISFSPNQVYKSIKKIIPNFEIKYDIDSRQSIADSWPKSIDDSVANKDWGWSNKYGLEETTEEMLKNIK